MTTLWDVFKDMRSPIKKALTSAEYATNQAAVKVARELTKATKS